MSRVLIADAVSADCDTILQGYGIEVRRAVGLPAAELTALLPGFEGMIVRSAVQVDAAMIAAMHRMRVIGRAGAGVDNIDVAAAAERGIMVMNTPGGNTISATEHTFALLMAMLRKIPAANTSLRGGAWDRKALTGTELMGKRVGVLGLGRIGREVARRLAAFDAIVLGHDPLLTTEAITEMGIAPRSFDELIAESDIVTIHVPLSAATRGMIGAAELARMRHGVFLVNCSRGGIIDEAALLAALDGGTVAGAALDVFSEEPPGFPSPLVDHPRVVSTPHIAASTHEAQGRVAAEIAHQVGEFLKGDGSINA